MLCLGIAPDDDFAAGNECPLLWRNTLRPSALRCIDPTQAATPSARIEFVRSEPYIYRVG